MGIILKVNKENNFYTIEDNRGNYHVLNAEAANTIINEKKYYKSIFLSGGNTNDFPRNDFSPITNFVTNSSALRYVVDTNSIFVIQSISAVQTRLGLTLIGLYKNNLLYCSYPIYREIHMNVEILIPGGTNFEVRIKPYHTNTKVALNIQGILIDV